MVKMESHHYMPQLTKEIINAAILGFEEQKSRIDTEIAELRAMIAPSSNGSHSTEKPAGRRKMSGATRKAMAEGQRRRWASKSPVEAQAPATMPKRKLSAAGKAAIVAALKKRWASKRAEAAKTTAAKK